MKKLMFSVALLISAVGMFLWLNTRLVHVINVHFNRYTAQVLVDHLPVTKHAKQNWWFENKDKIFAKFKVPSRDDGGPSSITVFAFGEGYQESGKEDRLCFDDMAPPKNCIDKNILLTIDLTGEGDTRIGFERSYRVFLKNGKIVESSY